MLLQNSYKLCTILHLSPPKTTKTHIFHKNNLKFISCFEGEMVSVTTRCKARRRGRFEPEEENEDDACYGYNEEIAMLELYSQSARGEALLVTAFVDAQQVEVLIFKGFSSCLSYRTSPDPSKSVLPQRAVIKTIDRIKGPFNPANIDYIEKGLSLESFTSRLPID